MTPHDVALLVNLGIGGVMLYLFLRQWEMVRSLQSELTEVRRAQWEELVSRYGEEHAMGITEKPQSKL